jgi:predicted metalloprotease with PDZ domain
LKLREATHEKQSLQTLFRWMNENYAKQGRFFADSEGVRAAAEKLSGADFREFFADYVSGVREIPWDTFFAPVGLHVVTEEVLYADPGFDAVQKFDRPPAIVRVQPGSPAEQAGAKAGDEIVSINGAPAGRDFGPQIDKVGAGAVLHLRIRRDGEPLELQWTLGERRIRIYRLEDVPAITPQQRAARASWLSGVAEKSTP